MQWRYEVTCLTMEGHSKLVILQAVRRSLRGTAAEIMRNLGNQITVDKLLSRLDVTFGNVLSTEQLFQEFYSARQRPDESISGWAGRLEALLTQLREQGSLNPAASQDMLRSKFWSGLGSDSNRMSSRHKFDAGASYEELVKYVRKIDFEVRSLETTKSKKSSVQQMTSDQTVLKRLDDLCNMFGDFKKSISEIKDRLEVLEKPNVLSQDKSPVLGEGKRPKYRKKLAILCNRCGRRGHAQKNCYAKIHADGTPLNAKAPSNQDVE